MHIDLVCYIFSLLPTVIGARSIYLLYPLIRSFVLDSLCKYGDDGRTSVNPHLHSTRLLLSWRRSVTSPPILSSPAIKHTVPFLLGDTQTRGNTSSQRLSRPFALYDTLSLTETAAKPTTTESISLQEPSNRSSRISFARLGSKNTERGRRVGLSLGRGDTRHS